MAPFRGRTTLMCHRCGEIGHKAVACPRASGGPLSAGDNFSVATSASQHSHRPFYSGFRHDLRPLDQVTCFKVSVIFADLVKSEMNCNSDMINCCKMLIMTRF